MAPPTIHAGAVLIGAKAVLIRGPAGAGKSLLALALLRAGAAGLLPFARLVADDRCEAEACAGRLLVRPAPELTGLLEVRGLGIRHVPYEPIAVAGLVVDLAASDSDRLPAPHQQETVISGVRLPRLGVPAGADALAVLLASVQTPRQRHLTARPGWATPAARRSVGKK
jgi:serine kinase of HPr protein (carbohydrate metabolism regulator)